MKDVLLCAPILALMLFSISGCGNIDASQPSQPVEIKTVAELTPFRGADSLGRAVTWQDGAVDKSWADLPGAEQVVQAAIEAASARLAAVDYAPLSLPDFVTQTRALKLNPTDFTGQNVHIDAHGEGSVDKKKWVLYAWQGPEFPPHPNRPLVHRWVYVYALYDVEGKRVARLLATIHGEGLE